MCCLPPCESAECYDSHRAHDSHGDMLAGGSPASDGKHTCIPTRAWSMVCAEISQRRLDAGVAEAKTLAPWAQLREVARNESGRACASNHHGALSLGP